MSASLSVRPRRRKRGLSNGSLAMAIYLISTVMLFSGLLVSYSFVRASGAAVELPTAIPSLLSLLALGSAGTVAWALRAVQRAQPVVAQRALALTGLAGLAFLGLMARELGGLGFSFRESSFASAFYLLAGFHALHVVAGLIMVGAMLVGVRRGVVSAARLGGIQATTFYWLMIQAIWLLLYVIVYLTQ